MLLIMMSCTNPTSMKIGKDYPVYGGNNAGNRFSPLNQINLANVKSLQVAWIYNANDNDSNERAREIECQPIVINGILYGTTPKLKLFALKAGTGEQLWKFDPSAISQGSNSANRGLNYWQEGKDKRILYVAGPDIYAINAITGKPIESFGAKGKVDLHEGLGSDYYDAKDLAITATSPGVIYKNILIIGSTVSESGDALPGHIRGFDVRTGKLLWIFHTIPHPGEIGYNTWPKDAYKTIGGVNCWAGMVLDEKSGIVYMGTGAPAPDYYGGNRDGENLFSNCILALYAETGKLKWYYQTIHHDLWDLDIPCQPNLVTVKHNGKIVDALVQTTKDGLVYVLDRNTGISLFPVEERPVPSYGVPGERPWPAQKFPLKPHPFSRQAITKADIPDSNFFPEAHAFFRQRFPQTRHSYKYIPPSIEGTIAIGISGGAEWGGNAVDPDGILFQNSSEVPWDLKLVDLASIIKKSMSRGNILYLTNCAVCHGKDRKGSGSVFPNLVNIESRLSTDQIKTVLRTGRGRMPPFQNISENDRNTIVNYLLHSDNKFHSDNKLTKANDEHTDKGASLASTKNKDFPYIAPYIRSGGKFLDKNGYPEIKPPWGTLNAIDLNTGEYLWRVTLGEYPELTKKGIPITGTENFGGPLLTAGGLVFIAGTHDEKIRAFDKKTGKIVWEYQLPAAAFATPITYEVDGKQYVAIAAGGVKFGHKPGGWYIAFALPNKK